ncbi:MAG: PIG-L family deacetylase, partial [Deltaproteobacteria bacterium]
MNRASSLQLFYRLKKLGMSKTVLHIGSHPDDEEIGLLSYISYKHYGRSVYWSATRGESGQNRVNDYQGDALGVYRTWESLSAREGDGGECLFGPFVDFGFSKNSDEAFVKWGRENVVREMVRTIRLVQPQIVISRWAGTPEDGHGQHQAVGQALLEAVEAAGSQDS